MNYEEELKVHIVELETFLDQIFSKVKRPSEERPTEGVIETTYDYSVESTFRAKVAT